MLKDDECPRLQQLQEPKDVKPYRQSHHDGFLLSTRRYGVQRGKDQCRRPSPYPTVYGYCLLLPAPQTTPKLQHKLTVIT